MRLDVIVNPSTQKPTFLPKNKMNIWLESFFISRIAIEFDSFRNRTAA